jgi:hypothetical protein
VTSLVDDLKSAIGAPVGQRGARTAADTTPRNVADVPDTFGRAPIRPAGESVGIHATRAD